MISALADRIAARPRAAFGWFLAIHVALWTLLPAVFYVNLPLDLIEAMVYGREWQLGHDKLPPLPWWTAEIVNRVAGVDAALYLLAQATVAAAFALVWATALPIAGPLGALVAVAIVDGLHYFNFTAPKFNHDVVQLPFWARAGFARHRALPRARRRDWLLLGIAFGGALWAKYFVVVLAIPLALFVLIDPQARRALATPGPYLAAAVALLIAAPHLVWLVQNDFLPLGYADARLGAYRGLRDHILSPAIFAGSQIVWLVPALLIALPLIYPPHHLRPRERADFEWRIVTLLAFGPGLCVILLSLVTGRGLIAMWGYPLWLFAGLWIVMASQARLRQALPRIVAGWAIVALCYAGAFPVHYGLRPLLTPKKIAPLYPGRALADELGHRYRAATGRPLDYLVADMWDGGNVVHYARENVRLLIDGQPARAPWIDMADFRRKGAVVIWETDFGNVPRPLRLLHLMENAVYQPRFEVSYHRTRAFLSVGWAIIPPRPDEAK